MTLDLSDEVLARLQREADRRGVSLAAVVAELASALPESEPEERKLGFVALAAYRIDRRSSAETEAKFFRSIANADLLIDALIDDDLVRAADLVDLV